MYTKEEQDLIVLACIDGMKSKTLISVACAESEEEKEDFLIKTLNKGVYNTIKEKFADEGFRRATMEKLGRGGVECVTYISPDYPRLLRQITDPPAVLFLKGNRGLLSDSLFAAVGSRRSSAGALALCKKICGELTRAFTVVTGIADGADSAAVEGALPSGKIISVLANGFDFYYPAANRALIEEVAKKGLLLSEYPPHIPPQRYYFPARNRIIAGLSEGTLVVSAGEKSGALITADCAAEYGREIFAFPYSPDVASGAGCNALIKNGAYLTENILDIFTIFGLDLKKSETPQLSSDEAAVYAEIKAVGEAFLPAIAQKLNKFTYQLIPAVTALEIKGLVVKLGGNRYGIV